MYMKLVHGYNGVGYGYYTDETTFGSYTILDLEYKQ